MLPNVAFHVSSWALIPLTPLHIFCCSCGQLCQYRSSTVAAVLVLPTADRRKATLMPIKQMAARDTRQYVIHAGTPQRHCQRIGLQVCSLWGWWYRYWKKQSYAKDEWSWKSFWFWSNPTKTGGISFPLNIPGNWVKVFLTAVYHTLLLQKWDGLCPEKNGLLFASSQQECNYQHIEKVSYVKCSALRSKAWSPYIV